jgi:hypothetical protein
MRLSFEMGIGEGRSELTDSVITGRHTLARA